VSALRISEPGLDVWCLISREVVEHDVDLESARHRPVDLFEEGEHVVAGVAISDSKASGPKPGSTSDSQKPSMRCVAKGVSTP
jgi:hypothetical protein